jgi:hypothetical protein
VPGTPCSIFGLFTWIDIWFVRFLHSLNFRHPQALNDTSLVNNGRQTILAPADDRECFFIPLPCHLIEGYQPQQQSQPQLQQDYQEQQQQEKDQLMGPTAFSLHYRIQKENATAARLRAGGDPKVADGGEGGFLEEFSFEVSDLLAEAENRRRAELNATRIVADIIRNISRILLVPRCGISRDRVHHFISLEINVKGTVPRERVLCTRF